MGQHCSGHVLPSPRGGYGILADAKAACVAAGGSACAGVYDYHCDGAGGFKLCDAAHALEDGASLMSTCVYTVTAAALSRRTLVIKGYPVAGTPGAVATTTLRPADLASHYGCTPVPATGGTPTFPDVVFEGGGDLFISGAGAVFTNVLAARECGGELREDGVRRVVAQHGGLDGQRCALRSYDQFGAYDEQGERLSGAAGVYCDSWKSCSTRTVRSHASSCCGDVPCA